MGVETSISFGKYLPSERLSNEDIEGWQVKTRSGNPLTAKDVVDKIGVVNPRTIARPDPEDTIFEMGLKAAQDVLGSRPDVDVVLFSTSTPTGEDLALKVARELGINFFDKRNFHLACAGGAGELSYLAMNQDRLEGARVLAIASEKLHPLLIKGPEMERDPAFSATIFSDGAYALDFRVGEGLTFHSNSTILMPEATHLIRMPNDFELARGEYSMVGIPKSEDWFIVQEGLEVYKAVRNKVPPVVQQLAEEAQFKPEDTIVISHQPSRKLVEVLAERLSQFSLPTDFEDGNYSSGSVFRLLQREVENNKTVSRGSQIVVVGFGAGMIITGVGARVG